jgi:hypothetical protein
MLELVLNSDHLILVSEDDAFALVMAWADGRPEREQKAAFDRLAPCLRLHRMSPIFLTHVVARSKLWSRLKPQQLTDAIAFQSVVASLSLAWWVALGQREPPQDLQAQPCPHGAYRLFPGGHSQPDRLHGAQGGQPLRRPSYSGSLEDTVCGW